MANITDTQFREIFQSPYNAERWQEVLINLFAAKQLRQVPELLETSTDNETGFYLGEIDKEASYRIGFFKYDIHEGSVVHKKVGLRNLMKSFTNPKWGIFDAVIAVFDDSKNWRVSLISDIKGEATSPKRYTYIFGDRDLLYNTAISRFMILQNAGISFESLKDAFSVEALTKQFYNELFQWYGWAIQLSSYPKGYADHVVQTRENNEQNIIRLITRIMFIWFIKQKKLVPQKIFDIQDLSSIISDFDPQSYVSSNYYNAILQNLFFATLNRAIIDEEGNGRHFTEDYPAKGNPHYGIKTFYRDNKAPYNSLFKITHKEVIEYFSIIPFLNGGLFECLDYLEEKDSIIQYYVDGFSREPSRRAFVPNILFFDPINGLIPLLSRYNFTIEENSPKDVQVALDPELLGKVFENLLGAYNPETKETARNQSGSFYTPREIVDYMIDESLKAYLGGDSVINLLFTQEDIPDYFLNNPDICERISRQLCSVKIFDPACGSGAFPMGALNRIVDLIERLDYNKTKDIGQIKLQLIEQCIYGSDIQTIAVQISKLRFFISLICHYERNDNDPTNNYGIPILPNLETKFVAANSLISIKKRAGLGGLFDDPTGEIEKTKKELIKIRESHFSANSSFSKLALRKQDKEVREKLAKLLSVNIYAAEDAQQMAEWDPYNQNKESNFFDPYWMYGIADGFDIVIGNPPYIQLQNNNSKLGNLYAPCGYETFVRTGDIYCLFYERGIKLLKNGGLLCYITSNKWMRAGYGEQIREYFAKNTNPLQLIDFGGVKVFESATVDTNILLIERAKNKGNTLACVIKQKGIKQLSDYIRQNGCLSSFNDSNNWVILANVEREIKEKIEKVGTPLKDWDIQINYGIKTGYNDAFIISGEKKDEIIASCQTEEERKRTVDIIRPILRGKDIKRYGCNFADKWLICIPAGYTNKNRYNIAPEEFIQKKYPAVYDHFIRVDKEYMSNVQMRKKSKGLKGRDDMGDYWWELRSCAYMDLFFQQKICWKAVGRNLAFSIVPEGVFLTAPASFISAGNYNEYILAFLCSNVGKYFIYQNSDTTGAGDIMLNIQSLIKFPVPKINPSANEIMSLISSMLKSPNIMTQKQIDKYIYKMYGFNSEEIAQIESC